MLFRSPTKYQNEILVNEDGSEQRKIITDSKFAIVSKGTKLFHMECQRSGEHSIGIHMFDHGSQIALENAVIERKI